MLTVILRDISYQKSIESTLESRVAERTAELEAEIARREQAQAQLVRSQRMEAFGQLTGGGSRMISTTCSPSSAAISN